jgi:hypothetical protein
LSPLARHRGGGVRVGWPARRARKTAGVLGISPVRTAKEDLEDSKDSKDSNQNVQKMRFSACQLSRCPKKEVPVVGFPAVYEWVTI